MESAVNNPFTRLNAYELRHLVLHLIEVGRMDDMHRLLGKERCVDGHFLNCWHEAHEQIADAAGFLNDVRRAWRQAERATDQEIREGKQAVTLNLEVRYAYVLASVTSLAGNVPPELLVALVKQRVWTPAQGLIHVQQMANPQTRAHAIILLGEQLDRSMLREALTAARQIPQTESRIEALSWFARRIAGEQRDEVVRELVAQIPQCDSLYKVAELLAELAPTMSQPLLREALLATQRAGDSMDRKAALVKLAPHLSEPLLREAMALARQLDRSPPPSNLVGHSSAGDIPDALAGIAPHLAKFGYVAEALAILTGATAADSSPKKRLEGILAIYRIVARSLPLAASKDSPSSGKMNWASPSGITETPVRVDSALPIPPDRTDCPEALALSVRYELDQAIRSAFGSENDDLSDLTLRLAESGYLDLAMRSSKRPESRVELSRRCAELGYADRAREIAGSIEEPGYRWKAHIDLIPHLPQSAAAELAQTALEAAWSMSHKQKIGDVSRAEALLIVAQQLGPPFDERVRNAVLHEERCHRQDASRSAVALARLTIHLEPPLRDEIARDALEVAGAMSEIEKRSEVIAALAPHLPAPLLLTALELVRPIRDSVEVATTLTHIARSAPTCREEVLAEIVRIIPEIYQERDRAEALKQVAPLLTQKQAVEAIDIARAVGRSRGSDVDFARQVRRSRTGPPAASDDRLRALVALLPQLPQEQRERVIQDALSALLEVKPHLGFGATTGWPELLPEIVECLPVELTRRLLEEEREVYDDRYFSDNLGDQPLEELIDADAWLQAQNRNAVENALAYARDTERWVLGRGQDGLKPGVLTAEGCRIARALLARVPGWNDLTGDKDRESMLYVMLQLKVNTEVSKILNESLEEKAEEFRGKVYLELLPRLCALGYAEESLGYAWGMPDRSWKGITYRMKTLARLSPYLPDYPAKKQKYIQLVDSAISDLTRYHEQREASDEDFNSKHPGDDAQRSAAMTAVEKETAPRTRKSLEDVSKRQILETLEGNLPSFLFEHALSVARSISDAENRVESLARLLPEAPEALTAQLLAKLAPDALGDNSGGLSSAAWRILHSPARLSREVIGHILDWEKQATGGRDGDQRALGEVAKRCAQQGYLQEAVAAVRIIREEDERGRVLSDVLSHLSAPLEQSVAAELLAQGLRVAPGLNGASVLGHLLRLGVEMPRSTAFRLFRRMLHTGGSQGRPELCRLVAAMAPALAHWGGADGVAGVFRAIKDVRRWWPGEEPVSVDGRSNRQAENEWLPLSKQEADAVQTILNNAKTLREVSVKAGGSPSDLLKLNKPNKPRRSRSFPKEPQDERGPATAEREQQRRSQPTTPERGLGVRWRRVLSFFGSSWNKHR